ncbi:MAG: TMEM165/GDT1 family protein [Cyanobacteria bacterium J06626_23]
MTDSTSSQAQSAQTQSPQDTDAVKPTGKHFWGVFVSTFFTIFLAELGDKTQVTTLLMSAGSQSPWTVFVGAAAALIATSLIGVLLGQWLSTRVSPRTLDTLAAVLLLLITISLMGDVIGV